MGAAWHNPKGKDQPALARMIAGVRAMGLETCMTLGMLTCGGIVGMGETRADRVGFLHALASMPEPPESVPISALVPVKSAARSDATPPRSGHNAPSKAPS